LGRATNETLHWTGATTVLVIQHWLSASASECWCVMPHRAISLILILTAYGCTSVPAKTSREPSEPVDPWSFVEKFRAADYLREAADLQQLEPSERANRLS